MPEEGRRKAYSGTVAHFGLEAAVCLRCRVTVIIRRHYRRMRPNLILLKRDYQINAPGQLDRPMFQL